MKAILFIGVTIFSFFASANPNLDWANKVGIRKTTSSAGLTVKAKYQPTYVTAFEGMVPAKAKCFDMVNKLSVAFEVESLTKEKFFSDYAFLCVPAGEDALIIVQLNVEAVGEKEQADIEAYLAKVNGISIFDHIFNFEIVKEIKIVKDVHAQHITDWDAMTYDFDLWMGIYPFKAMSFGHYLALQEEERLAFINPNVADFMAYLVKIYGADKTEEFRKAALVQSNYVDTKNTIDFVMDSGEVQRNKWRAGSFRMCPKYSGDYCSK